MLCCARAHPAPTHLFVAGLWHRRLRSQQPREASLSSSMEGKLMRWNCRKSTTAPSWREMTAPRNNSLPAACTSGPCPSTDSSLLLPRTGGAISPSIKKHAPDGASVGGRRRACNLRCPRRRSRPFASPTARHELSSSVLHTEAAKD